MTSRTFASTQRTTWLVALALVWVTLAPQLAQVVLTQSGRAGLEVCTSTGLLLVAPDDASQPVSHADTPSCEWAVHMGGLASMLPPAPWAALLGVAAVLWLGRQAASASWGTRWPMAQPRAPPHFS